jgi:HrpA-like RNA helicase
VVLEILAPNMRPVQITDDLEGFWKTHYPELKKISLPQISQTSVALTLAH